MTLIRDADRRGESDDALVDGGGRDDRIDGGGGAGGSNTTAGGGSDDRAGRGNYGRHRAEGGSSGIATPGGLDKGGASGGRYDTADRDDRGGVEGVTRLLVRER